VRLFRSTPPPETGLADIVRQMHDELGRGSPQGVDDRRAHARRACVGPVLILPMGDGDEPKLRDRRDGVAVDISDGGMRILSRVKLGSDRVVHLTLMGPRGGDHTVRCEVLRRRRLPSGYWELGVRFLAVA
jgi:hypothetical protein